MKKIEINKQKILINDKEGILFGGEFQYFRMNANLWDESLSHLKKAGLTHVSFYVPWIWHEIEEGFYDFLGETCPERNLIKFIKLCEKNKLSIIIRPGPYVYAEYQGFGIPQWLRAEHPEILIEYENGQKSNEVALNHSVFIRYVKSWFKSLMVVVGPYLKKGTVIAWQIDNETGLPQFGNPPYIGDFNPHTVKYYRKYLNKMFFGTIEKLNETLKTDYKSFEDIMPPVKGKASVLENRNWTEFIEYYIADYLLKLKNILNELKVDKFFIHNDPFLCQWPHKSSKKAEILPVGYDIYSKVSPGPYTHDIPFSISYAPKLFKDFNKQSILAGMEIGAGWFDNRVSVKPVSTMQTIMASLARGAQILNLYVLHDCLESDGTHWLWDAPLDVYGNTGLKYPVLESVGKLLKKFGDEIAVSQEITSPIGILSYHPEVLDMVKPNVNLWTVMEDLNNALTHFTGPSSSLGILAELGYNPSVIDLETASLNELSRFKVLFWGSSGLLDRLNYNKILHYVMNGGVLITYGRPVTKDLYNNEYGTNQLYPAKPYGAYNYLNYGNNNLISQTAIDIIEYQMTRMQVQHKLSLATIDMMQPFVEVMKYISNMGTWIYTDKQEKFWATRFISLWQSGSVNPMLIYENNPVGYNVRIKSGKSIFIGTLPLFFDSPAYYTFEEKKKESVMNFFAGLLKETGLKPLVFCDKNMETVLRRTDKELFVFLINRGNKKEFNLIINVPHHLSEPHIVFTFANSCVELRQGQFHGVMEEDDVLVFYLKQ